MHNRWWIGLGLAASVVVVAACGSNSAPADPAPASPAAAAQDNAATSSVTIETMSTAKGTVLATAAGLTVYWFAADTSTQSNCNGSCVSYWPPVLGTPAAASGASLPHGLGTIKRANGQTQATYDGHPLYTYAGDTAAGQINGNGLNASGGLWWAITPSGSDLRTTAAPSPSTSTTSGGGSGGW
jgi:predicted lipoprotein with Yx(FWY)xxD motif